MAATVRKAVESVTDIVFPVSKSISDVPHHRLVQRGKQCTKVFNVTRSKILQTINSLDSHLQRGEHSGACQIPELSDLSKRISSVCLVCAMAKGALLH